MNISPLRSSKFFRNIFVLASGTALAQAISVLSIPFLQRIYTPQDFGVLNLFITLSALFSGASTLKLEYAIPLAKTEEEVGLIIKTSTVFVVVTAVASIFILTFSGHLFLPSLNAQESLLFQIGMPIAIIGTGLSEIFNYRFNRKGNFKTIAIGKILQNSAMESFRFLSYLFSYSQWGLIGGRLIGPIACLLYFLRAPSQRKKEKLKTRISEVTEVLRRYQGFPLFTMPTVFITLLTNFVFVSFFMNDYGREAAGVVGIANQYVALPLGIIASSFSQVFYHKISELTQRNVLYDLYKRFALRLGALSVGFCVTVYLVPDNLPTLMLGDGWKSLMPYIRLTILWQGFAFVASSLSFIYTRLLMQKVMLVFALVQLGFVYLAVVGGRQLFGEAYETFEFYVTLQGFYYAFTIIAALHFIKKSPILTD